MRINLHVSVLRLQLSLCTSFTQAYTQSWEKPSAETTDAAMISEFTRAKPSCKGSHTLPHVHHLNTGFQGGAMLTFTVRVT